MARGTLRLAVIASVRAVTQPNHQIPPGQDGNAGAATAPYHGNGGLWTVLPDGGVVREEARRDGSIREKFPWWRARRGRLEISGRRLEGAARPLRARVPGGYGPTGFQSSGMAVGDDEGGTGGVDKGPAM